MPMKAESSGSVLFYGPDKTKANSFGYRLAADGSMWSRIRPSKPLSPQFAACDWAAIACAPLPAPSTTAATAPGAALSGASNPSCARSIRTLRTGSREWHNFRRVILQPTRATRNPFSGLGLIRRSARSLGSVQRPWATLRMRTLESGVIRAGGASGRRPTPSR